MRLSRLQNTSERGLDTEGLVSDGQDGFWLCDEYGPFLIHVDAERKNSGEIRAECR